MIYKGLYTHKGRNTSIEIHSDGKELNVEIAGLVFQGTEFTDLSYEEELAEVMIDNTLITLDAHADNCLTDCQFEFKVPQYLLTSEGIKEAIELEMCFRHGGYNEQSKGIEYEEVSITLRWNGEILIGKSGFVEIAFDQLMKQMPKGYSFVNCYGCLYGDYSIYGNSSFGTMMCFRNIKQKYKLANGKCEYDSLCVDERENIEMVQEIYCCNDFEVRGNGGAYR
ncbi:hypothetical protein HX017_18095 [Myroides marinus]|uniref:DUF6304 family protein n=1 Tax=Myroides marinus TaxID=703342 RepID=UPI002577B3F7|nr:DUF6304 family protein [Myroides marinus]MDM1348315.1 hypothetical protein [Myroides marinus]MDM1351854.1 hypothetical protein [Myroides marinus]MDM1355417.1 hypothetical protein [Myroides marinus]MDM1359034.1 hypothetical protein [Myroides marinus]MDM1366839.1 hypothetical protein [Myroides marinus]